MFTAFNMDIEVSKTIEINPQDVYFIVAPEGLLYRFYGVYTGTTIKIPTNYFAWSYKQFKRNRKQVINYPGLFKRLLKNFPKYVCSI